MTPHPILKNLKNLLIYLSAWLLYVGVSFAWHYFNSPLSLAASLTNSLLMGIFGSLLGIAIWYAVLYSYPEKVGTFGTFVNHLLAAIIFISIQTFLIISINKYYFNSSDYEFISRHIIRWIGPSVFFYVAFVLAYYIYIYRINLQEKKQEEVRLTRMVKEAELNLLKSQLNPHFLFNSLNSISALTLTDPKKAQEMIILLSDFLRYSLARDGRQLSSLTAELQNIERYMKIEKIRFGDRVRYTVNVEPTALSSTLPVMILQPVFENAIKHGVSESVETVNIELKAMLEYNYLIITVVNNFDPTSPSKKGAGVGLKNIEERLKLIYHNEGLIKYRKENNIFEVKLIIPQ
ncbi:MAG: sensor histidine kinase [Bacteroidales bacterium]